MPDLERDDDEEKKVKGKNPLSVKQHLLEIVRMLAMLEVFSIYMNYQAQRRGGLCSDYNIVTYTMLTN